MDSVDVLVIGAGVIGLAIAERLVGPKRELVVCERHDGFGRETSSRNSEVIHCGMYYAEDLLKTTLCVRGNPLLYELCARAGIPHRKTGKIVVATDESESEKLHRILDQGRRNGVTGLRLLLAGEIRDMEPDVSGCLGLHSPESGIVDSHRLMEHLERSARSRGAIMAYGCEVTGIHKERSGYRVEITQGGGETVVIAAGCVVNSAGLGADGIAAMAGIDIDESGYRIHPCKGEYFRIASRHRGRIRRLVYPTPSPVHLGAHVVLGLDDGLKIGPDSSYVDRIDYAVDAGHQREFFEKAVRFLPFLSYDDLSPDMSGIRPKLYRRGEPFRDFVIREEGDRGLAGLVNLIGMESPGLTSCLTIAEKVESLL
ncbi:MAG: NAD(P)/FAD-dependent oxidoreductase [Spirochaetia bacterium]|jgi:L-2-hydroxyglutarate oxidase LhgO